MMIRHLFEKFSNDSGREMFRVSEKKYDSKITEKCKKFTNDSLNNPRLYNSFLNSFSQNSKQNSKIFSKLKHE